MDGEDAMRTRASLIKFMLGHSFIVLSFEKHLKSVYFIVSLLFGQSFDEDVSFTILLDAHLWVIILIHQIYQGLVVKFQVRNGNFYVVLITTVYLLVKGR